VTFRHFLEKQKKNKQKTMTSNSRSNVLFSLKSTFSLLLLICLIQGGTANTARFLQEELFLDSPMPFGFSACMWSRDDTPAVGYYGDKTLISLHLSTVSWETENQSVPPHVAALIVSAQDRSSFGYTFGGRHHFCCTAKNKQQDASPLCNTTSGEVGTIVISGSTESPYELRQHFRARETIMLDIGDGPTGLYQALLVYCGPDEGVKAISPVATVSGMVTWQNPYGNLSGELYPFIPFYGVISVVYLGLGIIWFVLCVMHWRELLPLQMCIAGVMALGMMECVIWYFDFYFENLSGSASPLPRVLGVLVSTSKRTVSRLLVLIVSLGYGVVKANLGTTQQKVLLLGGCYFLFSFVFELTEQFERRDNTDVGEDLSTFSSTLVFPVALVDTCFYWWIFLALSRTISQLTARRQPVKLLMYRRFALFLIGSGLVSAFALVYQIFHLASVTPTQEWQEWWMPTAFWHVMYLVLLIAIAVIWRPTSNNLRYAYVPLANKVSAGGGSSSDDEEDVVLSFGAASFSSFGELTRRVFTHMDETDGFVHEDSLAGGLEPMEDEELLVLDLPVATFSLDDEEDEVEQSKLE